MNLRHSALELSCLQTDEQTQNDRQRDRQTKTKGYSVVMMMIPKYNFLITITRNKSQTYLR